MAFDREVIWMEPMEPMEPVVPAEETAEEQKPMNG